MKIHKNALYGVKVLIPRPLLQGNRIAGLIESHAGTAIVFPVVEIFELADFNHLDRCVAQLSKVDLIIFVSVSAVNGFASRLRDLDAALPENLQVAAVGWKTAQYCESLGIPVDFVPDSRFDSEGLLACMGDYDFNKKQAVIFRGQSGREWLRKELENRGCRISYVQTYHRATTTRSIQSIVEKWLNGDINAVLITSVSILDALAELLGNANLALLRQTPVITISSRIATQCAIAGIENILITDNPSDHGVLETMALLGGSR